MRTRLFITAVSFLVLLASAAHAQLPDYMLKRDYENCVGSDTNPQRIAYCSCVRKGMKNWDDSTYAEAALRAALTSNSGAEPTGKLAELAHDCLAQVMK